MSEDRWLTTGEAAKAVRVDPSTLNKWVKRGLIKPAWSTPVGNHHRWDLEDLKSQLAQLGVQSE